MCETGRLAILVLFFAPIARAEDAPAIHQAAPNFSNAIAGSGFTISWSADPTTLDSDDSFHLSITFLGAINPDRVRRPALQNQSAFKSVFREIHDEEPTIAPNAVTFHYRLRPRDVAVKAVPELAVAYFSPGNATVATKYLEAIPLTVHHPVRSSASAKRIDGPERFFEWPNEETGLRPGLAAWAFLAIGLVFLSLAGLALERYRNPEGARLARLRRVRAVRTALDELDRAARSPDPAASALEVLRVYIAARHGAFAPAATPADFAKALADANAEFDRIKAVRELASAGDIERFAAERMTADLVPRVRRLILEWEDAA
jgi:hypothetical protein